GARFAVNSAFARSVVPGRAIRANPEPMTTGVGYGNDRVHGSRVRSRAASDPFRSTWALAPGDDSGARFEIKSTGRACRIGRDRHGDRAPAQGGIPGLALAAVAARDNAAAQARLAASGITVRMVEVAALPEHCDGIVECAPASAFRSIAAPAI